MSCIGPSPSNLTKIAVSSYSAAVKVRDSSTKYRTSMRLSLAEKVLSGWEPFTSKFLVVGFVLRSDLLNPPKPKEEHHQVIPGSEKISKVDKKTAEGLGTVVPDHPIPWDDSGAEILLVVHSREANPKSHKHLPKRFFALMDPFIKPNLCVPFRVPYELVFFRAAFRVSSESKKGNILRNWVSRAVEAAEDISPVVDPSWSDGWGWLEK